MTRPRAGAAAVTSADDLARWLDARLTESGRRRIGDVAVTRVRPWGTILRAATDAGPVWLKLPAPATAFEIDLYLVLHRLAPRHVLAPIAADPGRGRLLLPDGGPTLRTLATDPDDALVRLLPRYAELQRATMPHVPALLAIGVADMRPHLLTQRFDEALTAASALATTPTTGVPPAAVTAPPDGDRPRPVASARQDAPPRAVAAATGAAPADNALPTDGNPPGDGNAPKAGDAPTAADMLAVAARRAWFAAVADRLAASPIPPAIDHADLHPGNVFAADGKIYDWGDSVIGHPFASMLVALAHARTDRPRDAYLEVFTDLAPRAALLEDLRAARIAGNVIRALTWYRALSASPLTTGLAPAHPMLPMTGAPTPAPRTSSTRRSSAAPGSLSAPLLPEPLPAPGSLLPESPSTPESLSAPDSCSAPDPPSGPRLPSAPDAPSPTPAPVDWAMPADFAAGPARHLRQLLTAEPWACP